MSIPVIGPKLAAPGPRTSPTKAVEIPAWNTTQYGFISNSEGAQYSGRRDIVPNSRKPPPPPPKLMVKSKIQASISTKKPPPVPKKRNVFGEDPEEESASPTGFASLGKSSNDNRRNMNIQLMAHGLNSQRQIDSNLAVAEEQSPSVYQYDEVYDAMQQAKQRVKQNDKNEKKASTKHWKEVSHF